MLSALFHGAVFVLVGFVFIRPPVVAVRESPFAGNVVSLEIQSDSMPAEQEMSANAVRPGEKEPDSFQELCREEEAEQLVSDVFPEIPLPDTSRRSPVPAPRYSPATAKHCARSRPKASVCQSGASDSRPDYLHNPPPVYPETSRLAGEEGVVMVRVEISSGGSVRGRTLVKSSGYPDLDREALRAVREWKFRPAVIGGFPVAASVTIPLRFEIHTKTS